MVKGIRPELGVQSGASKDGTKRILNSPMGTFTGSGLVRRIRSSRFHGVPGFFKERANFSASTKFATKVHPDILIGRVFAAAMLSEPTINEINGRGFAAKGLTIERATLVIGDEHVTAFPIVPKETLQAFAILGGLNDEPDINRDALIAFSGPTRVGFTAGMLG
jgi:hypothetical protein